MQFAQSVTEDAEVQLHATAIPENTTATTEWGCIYGMSGRHIKGGLAVVVLEQQSPPASTHGSSSCHRGARACRRLGQPSPLV